MAKKIKVVISQGQSNNPKKRKLEEDLVAGLLFEPGIEVAIVPHLYDLDPNGTGMLCLQGISGDMIVLSWLYPRAIHWILDRQGVKGHFGESELKVDEGESDDDDDEEEALDEAPQGIGAKAVPNRTIYCIDLRAAQKPEPFVEEIRRIQKSASVQTFDLMGWINGAPKQEQLDRYLEPTRTSEQPAFPVLNGASRSTEEPPEKVEPLRIEEQTKRRWYPVIDYSRCTNCMECLDFCLFGVYGVDTLDSILVEQPDNCKKGCPACSRVCPENAIIFPQHKTPAIAGSPQQEKRGLKIDLSKLFGAPDALEIAAQERDRELVADGREAVGLTVGIPKRQANREAEPRDELDDLVDQLDELEL